MKNEKKKRGGKTRTSFTCTWEHGKTKQIRVPESLVPQVLKIARILDSGLEPTDYKLIEFLVLKQKQYRRTNKTFDRSTPRWAVFNEFECWLKSGLSKW